MVMAPIDFPVCELGENARWNPLDGRFYFTDILNGAIYSADSSCCSARLELETGYQTGAFLISRNGDIALLTEKGLIWARRQDGLFRMDETAAIPFAFEEGERFNDAVADPEGRIIAGIKKADNRDGRLIVIEKDGTWRTVLDHLRISNGMGFSRDGATFYHTDSGYKTIKAYSYDAQNGLIDDGRVFFADFPEAGEPDGMAVDSDGNVWTAVWGAGTVFKISPSGELLGRVDAPAANVSSVAFGGNGFHTLFATSATCGLDHIGDDDGKCYHLSDDSYKGDYGYLV